MTQDTASASCHFFFFLFFFSWSIPANQVARRFLFGLIRQGEPLSRALWVNARLMSASDGILQRCSAFIPTLSPKPSCSGRTTEKRQRKHKRALHESTQKSHSVIMLRASRYHGGDVASATQKNGSRNPARYNAMRSPEAQSGYEAASFNASQVPRYARARQHYMAEVNQSNHLSYQSTSRIPC